ncbi:MAG: tetratricopeptide repeat protein [Anaerolineae bacterium]|nr:tetratricopeptide repeat protein [Anaerolineae bacterium]
MSQPQHPRAPRLYLLGPPQLERDESAVPISTRKAMALLAYLAVTEQAHSREALATLFWPEYDQARAFANLRRTLWLLNKALGKGWLDVDAETARLRHETDLWLDMAVFRDHLVACPVEGQADTEVCPTCLTSLAEAAALYRDDFMAGFTLPDSPGFDEWQFFEREGLRAELAGVLQRLVRCHAARRDYGPAIAHARRWLALDPLHEAAHRALMRLYAWDGQRAAALRQYRECARFLQEELGARPEEATSQLYEDIQAGRPPSPPGEPGQVSLAPGPRKNLPPQPTSFVGREAELAEIARLLRNLDCRLLALVGPGGVGKSRLALEAAARQADRSPALYAHGVCFVPLAGVSAAEFVVPSIASALGFSFYEQEGADARQQLLDYLRQKRMLLLLDNLEHLLDDAGLLSEILDQAPGVRLLVTSRERLNLQGEWVLDVPGMRYLAEETVESPSGYDAVQLFLRRASQVDAGFAPSEEMIPDLIRICRLVDGLPLAIELAAAWTRMLSIHDIVAHLAGELGRGLDLLTSSVRDVPARHRSLRAVCDHSWALLSAEEQDAFAQLSIFRGGFQRETAEQVAGAHLPLLSALVDKSLVRPGPFGRYDVHPILQQYGAEKLAENPQAEADARDRHSVYFFAFLQQREGALKGPRQLEALAEIEADLDNVRAAWRWAIAQDRAAEIRKASHALWLFYERRSLFEEGERAFARALEMPEGRAGQATDADIALGLALAFQGRLCMGRFCLEDGAAALRKSLAILRRLDAKAELGLALSFVFQGGVTKSLAEAETLFHESLAINRELGKRWEVAFGLLQFSKGVALDWRGLADQESVKQYLQESYAISSELGDRWIAAAALVYLAEHSCSRGALQEGIQLLQESLTVMREIGDGQSVQYILDNLGYYARVLGQYEEARRLHRESLAVAGEIGDGLGVAGSLDNLGLVAYDVGDYEEATGYFEQGLALRRQLGRTWETSYSLQHLGDTALARGAVDEALRRYRELLDVAEGFDWLQVDAWRSLGEAHLARGDATQAREHFRTALEMAVASEALDELLDTLRAVAQLAAGRGEIEWAVELLAHAVGQPDINVPVRAKAKALLADLAPKLPAEAVDAARERGQGKALDVMVQEVLQVLAS